MPFMKRSKQIFVAVVLVLSVVLSLKFGRKLLKDVSSTKEALPQPDVAAPLPSHKQTSLATTNFIFQWGKMGDVSTYRVRYSIRVVPANGGNFDVSATINNATIKGYYHVRVLKSSAEDVVLGTQFSHTEIRSMERAGVLEQFLNTTPVAIRFSRQGQILGYRLPDKASAMDRQFLMGMNCFQIVSPLRNFLFDYEFDLKK